MRKRSRKGRHGTIPLCWEQFFAEDPGNWLLQPLRSATPPDPDFEMHFCQDILRRAPDHPEALGLLGEAYARRGEYTKGLEADLRLSRLRPHSGVVYYNLACSYALTGQKDEALGALREALELGYRDLEHIRQDQDLEILRGDRRYVELVEQLHAQRHETEVNSNEA